MTIRYDPTHKRLECAVRDLLLETLDERFAMVGALQQARQQLGRQVHATHQAEKTSLFAGYRKEKQVSYRATIDGVDSKVTGRIDGLLDEGEVWTIEEVKSVMVPGADLKHLSAQRLEIFCEQAAIYALMLEAEKPPQVRLRATVVLVSTVDGTEHSLEVDLSKYSVQTHIENRIRRLLLLLANDAAEIERRRDLAQRLPFPFSTFRPGQDRLVKFFTTCAEQGQHALAEAPTGIGKTAAALFAMTKDALNAGTHLFYVTPKNTQHPLVLNTAARWQSAGVLVRVVGLRAKAKMCLNTVVACHPDLCVYAKGYYEKLSQHHLPQALWATSKGATEPIVITPEHLRDVGQRFQVCPFELGLDLSLSADVIVGDYNYVFDPSVALHRFFSDDAVGKKAWTKPRLVVDEAHALYDRGCEYYSPALWREQLDLARKVATALGNDIGDEWVALLDSILAEIDALANSVVFPPDTDGVRLLNHGRFSVEKFVLWRAQAENLLMKYLVTRRAKKQLSAEDALLDAAFGLFRFENAVKLDGPEFAHLIVRGLAQADQADPVEGFSRPSLKKAAGRKGQPVGLGLKIHCSDPAKQLARRLGDFHSVAAMSGTLSPLDYHRRVLGFPASRTESLSLTSPFPRRHLAVFIDRGVSTIYSQRAQYVDRIAQTILRTASVRPGNYLAAFPSYDYLRQIAGRLRALLPESLRDVCVVEQTPGMDEKERQRFLTPPDFALEGPRIMLVVQGGIFAEGVDYSGDACIGAFVVGPALPRVGVWQELKKAYFEQHEGEGRGFDFAYLYPGMTRVIQAAGRVIRTETDIGFVALMDYRFASAPYQACFPRWWYDQSPAELVVKDLAAAAHTFWSEHGLI